MGVYVCVFYYVYRSVGMYVSLIVSGLCLFVFLVCSKNVCTC